MNHYKTLAEYPNNRRAHQLRIFKNGDGECSCHHWELFKCSESEVVRTHQHHVANHEPMDE